MFPKRQQLIKPYESSTKNLHINTGKFTQKQKHVSSKSKKNISFDCQNQYSDFSGNLSRTSNSVSSMDRYGASSLKINRFNENEYQCI